MAIEPKSAFGAGPYAAIAPRLGVLLDMLDARRIRLGMEFLDLGTGPGIFGLGCCLAGLHGAGTELTLQWWKTPGKTRASTTCGG